VLTVLVPLLVIACHLFAKTKYPTHMREMVEELGSILVFAGRPLPNNSATKLVFIQYRTNDSWGIYLQDIASGKRTILDILPTDTWREGVVYEQLRTLGWSPDDNYFAFCRGKHKEIVICDINSGQTVGVFQVSKPITTGVWLSPQTLACSDGQQIYEFIQSGNQWMQPREFVSAEFLQKIGVSAEKPIELLQAFSPDTLLWKQDNSIWSSSKAMEAPAKLWQATTDELVAYSYSQEARKFLLHLRDKQGDYFADLNLQPAGTRSATLQDLAIPLNLVHPERIESSGYRPTQVRLINHGLGYAYLNESDFSLNTPVVKIDKQHAPVRMPWRGEIKGFAISQQQLFVISSLTNEPAGIWQYDLATGSFRSIVSNQEHPFRYATSQPTTENRITNASGKALTYYLLEPSHFSKNRKTPLVVGVMGKLEKAYNWDRYAQTIANCGYYFMIVDRRTSDQSEWGDDAVFAYENLIAKADIDTNNVCLLGISVGAGSANELLQTRPELWSGALYYSPNPYPDPLRVIAPRMLIDIGALDQYSGTNGSKAKIFRDTAASRGVDVKLFIRPDVGHNCRLLSIEKERLHQLAIFLANRN